MVIRKNVNIRTNNFKELFVPRLRFERRTHSLGAVGGIEPSDTLRRYRHRL